MEIVLLIIAGICAGVYKIMKMPLDLSIVPRLMDDFEAQILHDPNLHAHRDLEWPMRDITPSEPPTGQSMAQSVLVAQTHLCRSRR